MTEAMWITDVRRDSVCYLELLIEKMIGDRIWKVKNLNTTLKRVRGNLVVSRDSKTENILLSPL